MAVFVNYTYADLFRNLFTPAPYLRSFSADSALSELSQAQVDR